MKKTRITDQITYVEPDTMSSFKACAGMIVRSKKTVLIDTNMGFEETPELIRAEKPDAAIITHYHLDHSVWLRQVIEGSGASVLVPEKESPYLSSLEFFVEHTAGPLGQAEAWQRFSVADIHFGPIRPHDCYARDTAMEDLVPEMVLVETPGHSPAHTSFYFPDEKILFAGDLGLDRFGPWYGWMDCSIKKSVESILRLDGMAVNLILTSHGGIVKQNIQKTWAACIRTIHRREEKIRRQLEQGRASAEIIRDGIFFPDKDRVKEPMKSFLYMWDTAMFRHHERLIRDGGLIRFFPEIRAWCGESTNT